jgi:hypothetical protein
MSSIDRMMSENIPAGISLVDRLAPEGKIEPQGRKVHPKLFELNIYGFARGDVPPIVSMLLAGIMK